MSDDKPPSPLALGRSKRANAGAKMNQLLTDNKSKTDEFYATTYGGFVDEDDDIDYEARSDDGDVIDSDFDIDVSDEEGEQDDNNQERFFKRRDFVADDDEDEQRVRRRKALKRKRQSLPPVNNEMKKQKKSEKDFPKDVTKIEQVGESAEINLEKKRSALRTSTQIRSELGEARRKREQANYEKRKEARDRTKQKRALRHRRMTQEERLEEAKFTEARNSESLERYRQFEELKKAAQRVVKHRKIHTHHSIRYWSGSIDGGVRTLLSFGDKAAYKEAFRPLQTSTRPLAITRKICPLTGQTARYFDPVTKLPYANLDAFKMLRQIHASAVAEPKTDQH